VRGAIRNFLRTPYLCDEADDGSSAIQTAEENHCELLVLDLNMPNMNGVETASIMRRRLPQVKIIGFSALIRDAESKDELLATKNFDAVLSELDGLQRFSGSRKSAVARPN
jgi:CheY-like chemotaxis protein